ncbi:MAG: hypothetical protein IJE07_03175 [Clostridia bacterium]|nr:hypothetical protein [Clostridia bacterium]
MQSDFIQLMQSLAPDLLHEMSLRALVLERIAMMAPVGRRQLAAKLGLTEREIRAASGELREGGFIHPDASGMTLTERGRDVLEQVREFTRALHGLAQIENELSAALGVGRVCVVTGDADADESVHQEAGRVAAQRVKSLLHNGSTLAVTGGSTIAAVARAMQSNTPMRVMVVPARGGLGRADVTTQANTLAAEIAGRLGGSHRLIHLPDHMDEAAKQEMLRLSDVREVIELIQRADVILHGIGCAEENIRDTKLSPSQARKLLADGAVGEAFGSYFDREGRCLLESSSIGVDLARLSSSSRMIAVACGKRKAEAILAVLRHDRHALLVTDEGAAREMLRLINT